jgi:hypothetical protein
MWNDHHVGGVLFMVEIKKYEDRLNSSVVSFLLSILKNLSVEKLLVGGQLSLPYFPNPSQVIMKYIIRQILQFINHSRATMMMDWYAVYSDYHLIAHITFSLSLNSAVYEEFVCMCVFKCGCFCTVL